MPPIYRIPKHAEPPFLLKYAQAGTVYHLSLDGATALCNESTSSDFYLSPAENAARRGERVDCLKCLARVRSFKSRLERITPQPQPKER